MKVLVVDDSRVMRQIVMRCLRQAGFGHYDFVEAVDGIDALEKVREHDPGLVLSDWNMPRRTGLELLAELRMTGSSVPFGFVTSEGSAEMRAVAEQAGARFVVAKPFTPEAFRAALDDVLV